MIWNAFDNNFPVISSTPQKPPIILEIPPVVEKNFFIIILFPSVAI